MYKLTQIPGTGIVELTDGEKVLATSQHLMLTQGQHMDIQNRLELLIARANRAEKLLETTKNIQYKLIWNEDSDRAWGAVKEFENEETFIEQIKAEYKSFDGSECVVENIEKQWMILSGSGIPAEMAIPITDLDIEIGQYYSADVYEVEENE
jgi:hypothetical protein